MLDGVHKLAVARDYGLGRLDAGLGLQRLRPGELAANAIARVITRTVHPQHQRARPRRNQIHHILGMIWYSHRRVLESPTRHGPRGQRLYLGYFNHASRTSRDP
jgi:hypothetical protein